MILLTLCEEPVLMVYNSSVAHELLSSSGASECPGRSVMRASTEYSRSCADTAHCSILATQQMCLRPSLANAAVGSIETTAALASTLA